MPRTTTAGACHRSTSRRPRAGEEEVKRTGPTAAAIGLALAVVVTGRARGQDDETAEKVEVHGTVVVEDEKGATVDDESGTIVIDVHDGNGYRPQKFFL